MKKIAFTFSILFCILTNAWSQSDSGTEFRFGPQVSPTWSWLRTGDKDIEGAGVNLGLKLGVTGEFYFGRNYAIVSGLGFGFNQGGTLQTNYSQNVFWKDADLPEGVVIDEANFLPGQTKLHYGATYVEIPLGLKMRGGLNSTGPIRYYAEIPVFTLGFRTQAKGDIRGTNLTDVDNLDIQKEVTPLSLSWGLGAGIEYEISSTTTLVGGIHYQQQFTDYTKDNGRVYRNGAYQDDDSKATFGLLAVRIGILF